LGLAWDPAIRKNQDFQNLVSQIKFKI